MAGRVTLIGLLIACIVAGCGGGASSISTAAGGHNRATPADGGATLTANPTGMVDGLSAPAPSFAELNAMLQAEFVRLGIDPGKVTAAAPKGGTNVVFDLTAELIDADGAGGDPPTGIALAWTERLLGDYNSVPRRRFAVCVGASAITRECNAHREHPPCRDQRWVYLQGCRM